MVITVQTALRRGIPICRRWRTCRCFRRRSWRPLREPGRFGSGSSSGGRPVPNGDKYATARTIGGEPFASRVAIYHHEVMVISLRHRRTRDASSRRQGHDSYAMAGAGLNRSRMESADVFQSFQQGGKARVCLELSICPNSWMDSIAYPTRTLGSEAWGKRSLIRRNLFHVSPLCGCVEK